MTFNGKNIDDFARELSSKSPTPGGGGASALVGALGAALGSMVGNLTVGKAKYAGFEGEIKEIMGESERIRLRLLQLVDEDAKAFAPLAKAYSIPKDDPNRDCVMEKCLREAAAVPMEMLELSCKVIKLHERLEEIGSVMAVSDVGTGIVFCWAAMYGAAMNVRINTHSMKDRDYADSMNARAEKLMEEHWKIADKTYEKIWERLA